MAQGDVLVSFTGHSGSVARDLITSKNSSKVASLAYYPEDDFKVWDCNTGSLITDLAPAFDNKSISTVRDSDFNSNDNLLYAQYQEIGVIDSDTGSILQSYSVADFVETCKFIDNDSKGLYGMSNGIFEIIDLSTGTIESSKSTAYSSINEIESNIDDTEILVSFGGTMKIYERSTGNELYDVPYTSDCNALDVSHDGSMFVINSSDIIRVYEYSTKNKLLDIDFNDGIINSAYFSPQDEYIVVSTNNGSVYIIEVATGNIFYKFTQHTDKVKDARWCDGRTKIASITDGVDAKVWDSGLNPPPLDVTLTMPGYFSSSIIAGNITKDSTTEMDGYYSSPINFDMARVVDIFRKILDVNPQITRKATKKELEITRVADGKVLDIVKVGDAYE